VFQPYRAAKVLRRIYYKGGRPSEKDSVLTSSFTQALHKAIEMSFQAQPLERRLISFHRQKPSLGRQM
jgi:hypothetical protein